MVIKYPSLGCVYSFILLELRNNVCQYFSAKFGLETKTKKSIGKYYTAKLVEKATFVKEVLPSLLSEGFLQWSKEVLPAFFKSGAAWITGLLIAGLGLATGGWALVLTPIITSIVASAADIFGRATVQAIQYQVTLDAIKGTGANIWKIFTDPCIAPFETLESESLSETADNAWMSIQQLGL